MFICRLFLILLDFILWKKKKKEFKDIPGMFEGPVLPVLIKLSVPMLAGMIVQLLYNITDTIFISV